MSHSLTKKMALFAKLIYIVFNIVMMNDMFIVLK